MLAALATLVFAAAAWLAIALAVETFSQTMDKVMRAIRGDLAAPMTMGGQGRSPRPRLAISGDRDLKRQQRLRVAA